MSLLPPYVNRELFSEHYLARRIQRRPEWDAARAAAAPVLATLRALLAKERKKLPKYNEEQLRKHWLDPIFAAMGGVVDPEPSMPTDDARVTLHPDYVLFSDDAARIQAQGRRNDGEVAAYFRAARFIGDAKVWGSSFTKASKGLLTPRQQLTDYLHGSQIDWGFLTDGRKWRLTHRTVAGRLDHFYEVDLVDALDSPNDEHFLFFFAFFGPAAWRLGDDGLSLLDHVRAGSESYAREVGEGLKDSVYEALELVGRGFIRRGSVAPLPELRDECLTLLYRLLFLFYAEDRELLPVNDVSYAPYSLRRLAQEIAEHLDAGLSYSSKRRGLWSRLVDLFQVVDKGDSDLKIPPYNGGLFNPRHHALLATADPGDLQLALAIDLLARTRAGSDATSGKRERIDYRDLDIRHLGTIYEGLLEYELKRADRELVIVGEEGRTKKVEPFVVEKHSEAPENRRIATGEVYSATGNEERHATGSFYTPDYIVSHVVKQTLEPRVQGRTPEEILKLRVVDPAMGSGHFLLEAVDFLAHAYCAARVVGAQGAEVETSDGELAEAKRLVVEHCIYGVDLNPMAVELAKLALWLATMAKDRPLTFLNLHLQAGNSLLGIRIEDVGKLPAARRGKRARKQNGNGHAQQDLPLFAQKLQGRLPAMLTDVLEILRRETRTKADVEAKEELEKGIEGIRAPFRDVADVQATLLLSSLVDEVDKLIEEARPAEKKVADVEKDRAQRLQLEFGRLIDLIEQPETLFAHPLVRLTREERGRTGFFHWELMFPEVFYDKLGRRRDDAGFDAVIGNPPWIRQEIVGGDKDAFEVLYPKVFHGVADIYVFFVAAAMKLVKSDGLVTLVLPNKWLKTEYAGALRAFLTTECRPLSLIDFGHAPVFPDADTFPCILSLCKPDGRDSDLVFTRLQREDLQDVVNLREIVSSRSFHIRSTELRPEGWYPVPPAVAALLAKIRSSGSPLSEFTGKTVFRGVVTGFNDAFFIDQRVRDALVRQDGRSSELLHPFIRGADVERWTPAWAGEWLIFSRRGVDIDLYPAIKKHLSKHRRKLEPKPKGHIGAWEGRAEGDYKWFEIQASTAYYEKFATPKIIWQEIMFHSRFAFDDSGLFLNNKSYMIEADKPGILSCMNSSLLWTYMTLTLPHMKDEALSPAGFLMEQLPVASFHNPAEEALVRHTKERRAIAARFIDWLQVEMEVPKPTHKMHSFWRLSDKGLGSELKKGGLKLTSAALARVRDEFGPAKREYLDVLSKVRVLERRTQNLVHEAYGLTPEEIALVEQTASLRDPMKVLDQEFVPFEE